MVLLPGKLGAPYLDDTTPVRSGLRVAVKQPGDLETRKNPGWDSWMASLMWDEWEGGVRERGEKLMARRYKPLIIACGFLSQGVLVVQYEELKALLKPFRSLIITAGFSSGDSSVHVIYGSQDWR